MALNVMKCQFIIMGEGTCKEVYMNIDKVTVQNSQEQKILRVLIAANLSSEKRINNFS